MDYFSKLANKLKLYWKNITKRFTAYIKRLFSPIYLFPIKLITYSLYYLVVFLVKLLIAFVGLIFDCIRFPFRSLKNFLKSLFILVLGVYLIASVFVILDYLSKQYGYYGKFLCSFGVKQKLQGSVVRIIGGYSEGSGFFVSENQVITNFHVIVGEPSPKIIFPDGKFITPVKIIGNKDADLALLFTEEHYPNLVFPLPDTYSLYDDEILVSTGYPMGSTLSGNATTIQGRFIDYRKPKGEIVTYIQTDITGINGMSGGPLTDQCGDIVGVNTSGLSGISFFINAADVKNLIPTFTDQGIEKIEVDPSVSPEEAVKAYYTYLKARRMQDGFNLLSEEYLQKTNFEEWTNRFKDILDVDVISTGKYDNTKDTVFIKFSTKNWVDGEVEYHYYEGTWKTIEENGVYKMLKSMIKEVVEPGWNWFYE